ncbi:hypothetical protein FHW17_003995 [Phyllobacterium sp. P30BS-XVII]|nr:hypothetical protein [Phyllobacterium sp. P30BS-XVII]
MALCSAWPLLSEKQEKGTFAQVSLPVLRLLINQDCLLPSTWDLVSAMNAAYPAAGAFLALQQFVAGSLNATLARVWLFRVIHPADELIPTEWRQIFPQHKDFRIRSQGCLKVFACFVDSAMWKSVRHATSKQFGRQAEFTNSGIEWLFQSLAVER